MGYYSPVLEGDVIAGDLETTGVSPYHGDMPFAFPLCNEEGRTWYADAPVDPYTRIVSYSRELKDKLRSVYENPRIRKIFFNANFDVRMLRETMGIRVRGRIEEVSFAAACCNTLEQRYALKPLADKYLGYPQDDQDALKDWVKKLRRKYKKSGFKLGEKAESDYWLAKYDDPDNDLCEIYATGDVERTILLWIMYTTSSLWPTVRKTYEQEMVLWYTMYDMVTRGPAIDMEVVERRRVEALDAKRKEVVAIRRELRRNWRDRLQAYANKHGINIRELQGPAYTKTGKPKKRVSHQRKWYTYAHEFNPNSNKQLQWLLYEYLQLDVTHTSGKKGKLEQPMTWEEFKAEENDEDKDEGKNASTNWQVLSKHSNHSLIARLLRYRSHEKSRTFYDNYRELAAPDMFSDGSCLHPNFIQCEAKTGRFKCRAPNLQNVAYGMTARSRGVVPFSTRTPFGPRPGYVWLFCDYKQLEARLFADCAEEPFMMQAFLEGRDFHTECCNKAWGGEGNEGGVRSIKFALALDRRGVVPSREKGEYGDESVFDVWKRFGFAGVHEIGALEHGGSLSERSCQDAERVARRYLEEFEWDIVKAEYNIGQEVSRNRAKSLLFCRIFGGGAEAAMDLIQCSLDEAKQFMKDYDEEFPRIDQYLSELTAFVLSQPTGSGFIINRAGRRLSVDNVPRRIYDEKRGRWKTVNFAYRAGNYSIQSLAADLLKMAMRRLDKFFKSHKLDAHVLLTIHDELVLEVAEDLLNPMFVGKVKRMMEYNAGWVSLPTPVDIDMARKTWDEKEKLPFKIAA